MHMTENNENWILVRQKITQRKRRAKGSENSPQQTNLSWSIHALGSKVALLWAASKMKLKKEKKLSWGVPKKKAKKPSGASSLFHLVSGSSRKGIVLPQKAGPTCPRARSRGTPREDLIPSQLGPWIKECEVYIPSALFAGRYMQLSK